MGQHIEEMEQVLRQAFPNRDEEFYEYGKWGGGAFASDAFFYANLVDKKDNPVIVKPVSFLDTIEYIDWDIHTKDFTMKEYLNFIEEMDKNDKVYFIDRAEIKDGMMKMYPVKRMKANY